jgi:hypothetical protein
MHVGVESIQLGPHQLHCLSPIASIFGSPAQSAQMNSSREVGEVRSTVRLETVFSQEETKGQKPFFKE